MAGATNDSQQFNSQLYLSPDQQDLLMAALNSNNPNNQNAFGQDNKSFNRNGHMQSIGIDGLNPAFFSSPQQGNSMQNLDNFAMDGSPFGDFLDGDTSFDFDQSDPALMIENLPEDSPPFEEGDLEAGDKRKNLDEENEEAEGGAKRREGEDKTAKKPGRKPLTSEPTTKRKAQNRAAQRAFRERKEKHLKDLETKVAELEKESSAANHENGLLRAQVSRLQTELREYRKRMSLNSSSLSRSPPIGGFASYLNGNSSQSNFQFEFPRFGGLPGAPMFNNGPLSKSGSVSANTGKNINGGPGVLMRQSSSDRSLSPRSQSGQSVVDSPPSINGAVSKTSTNVAGRNSSNSISRSDSNRASFDAHPRASIDSTSGQSRVFQFKPNSGSSTSMTNSPSASSASHYGPNSSTGTSPDPAQNSPAKNSDLNMDTIKEGYVCHGNSEGEIAFCEKLNMACGNPRNPVPRAMAQSNGNGSAATKSPNMNANTNPISTPSTSNNPKTPSMDVHGIDSLASQNGGQFDPILFGDYRESQAAIVGDGDFTNGFFNDAFMMPDFGSPFQFGDTPAVQKSNPIDEIEKLQDGEEVVPGEDIDQMLNCHKIWDKLSARPDFQEGNFDIDGLCSELRAKARCSESGVVVDKKDVDAALLRAREKEMQAKAQQV